jgi:hypothetical protein
LHIAVTPGYFGDDQFFRPHHSTSAG